MHKCTELLLNVSRVVVRFGAMTALDRFDLQVEPGEIVGLVGHNGAGKTTLAHVVAGLVRPDSGTVMVAGTTPRRARPVIGLAPQELALYPTASARDNLLVFAGLYGMSREDTRRRITQLTGDLALDGVLDRRVRDLSGGQQRRLQAATAMIHRPRVLLLDEPTVGADPVTRDALLSAVRAAADDGAAIVYTTHYLPELETLDATLAVADHGRIIARGDRSTLLADVPGHAVVTFDDRELRITAPDPAAAVISAITDCLGAQHRLLSIELHPPTLDDLYRHLVVPCV